MDDTLYKNLTNSTQELEKMSKLLSNVYDEINRINEGCKSLGNNLISNAFGDFSTVLSMTNGLNTLGTTIKGVTEAGTAATSSFGSFTQVLTNISSVSLFVTALGGIVSVVKSIVTHTLDANSETDKYIEKLREKRDAIHENTEEMKKNNEVMVDNANAIKVDYGFTLKQVDELVKLTGENGYISNLSNARFLVDQINKVLPNSVSITEKGTLAWVDNTKSAQENADAIKEGIRELEKRELLESMSKDAAEAFDKRKKYEMELTDAKKAHKMAQDNVAEAEEKYNKILAEDGPNYYYAEKVAVARRELETQNGVLEKAEEQFATNEKVIKTYCGVQESLSDHVEGTAKYYAELYTEIGDKGTATWESLADALIDLDRQQEIHLQNGKDNQDEEVKINTRTTELIMEQCIAKAGAHEDGFNYMLATLSGYGVKVTGEEYEIFRQQYENCKENIDNKVELQKLGYDRMLTQIEENGVAFSEKEKEILNSEVLNWLESAKSKEEILGLNSETLLLNLENAGIKLNETQKTQLMQGCEIWKNDAINKRQVLDDSISSLMFLLTDGLEGMNEETRTKLIDMVKLLTEGGIEGGLELCQELSASLAKNGGEVSVEALGIINKISDLVEDANPELNIGTKEPDEENLKKIGPDAEKKLGLISLGIALSSLSKGFEIAGKVFGINILHKADGGFVDTGELFVAREAGPELVGRINGKTAVANNDQIVSGISSGVYNAMIGAMSKSNRNNTTVTAIFQVDGKQVAKQVINAHNKEVMQTGRSPLLI